MFVSSNRTLLTGHKTGNVSFFHLDKPRELAMPFIQRSISSNRQWRGLVLCYCEEEKAVTTIISPKPT